MENEADDKSKKQGNKEENEVRPIEEKPKRFGLFNNRISYFGTFVALVAAFLLVLNIGFHLIPGMHPPYEGIVSMGIYMALMPMMVFGVILILVGMYFCWRKRQSTGEIPYRKWPSVDFNNKGHRIAILIIINVAAVFGLILGVANYEVYHYTETLEFCGETCHEVMHPEAIAYVNSPHASVACAHCHIGPGISYFLKSKISGAKQMYAVAFKTYPKPVPTPLEHMRPAQDICEECHWAEKFFEPQHKQLDHYKYDEENTHWPINMLLKTDIKTEESGQTSGIHWHMNIGAEVEYIARDERRQDIPWVKITDKATGLVTIYNDETDPLTAEEVAAATPRVMDCLDCHNRPSHLFQSPDATIDKAIQAGKISQDIPHIKRIAVESMIQEYESNDVAQEGIANYIIEFYRTEMPETYRKEGVAIDEAIVSTQEIYANNIFPDMKVKWSYYLVNIGHYESPGCMRCHSGNHKDGAGIPITRDCKDCHIILSQGSGDDFEVYSEPDGLDFKHPKDISKIWNTIGCYRCHKGIQP